MQPHKHLSTTRPSESDTQVDANNSDEIPASLAYQYQLQRSLNKAFFSLINELDTDKALYSACALIGEACESNGVFLFKDESQQKTAQKSIPYFAIKKTRDAWNPSLEETETEKIGKLIWRNFTRPFNKSNTYTLNLLQAQDRSYLLTLDIHSICLLPILVENSFWGAILITKESGDNYSKEIEDILHDMSRALGSFIERHQKELALKNQRDYLNKVIDLNPSFIFARDRKGNFTLANQSLAKAYGTSVEALVNKKDSDFLSNSTETSRILEEDLEIMDKQKAKFVPSQEIVDLKGNKRYLQIIKSPIIGENGIADEVLGVAVDITKEHQAQEKAREERQLKDSIIATLPDHIVIVNKEKAEAEYFNANGALVGFEFSKIDQPYEFFLDLIHPDDIDIAYHQFQQKIENAKDNEILETEYRMKHKNGNWTWFSERGKVFSRFPDGKVKEYLIILQEITEKKAAEEALRESEQRYKNFINISRDGIYYMHLSEPISVDIPIEEQIKLYYEKAFVRECNDALAHMYGLNSKEDLLGQKSLNIRTGEYFDSNVESGIKSFLENNYILKEAESIEPDENGEIRYFLNQAVGLVEDGKLLGIWGTQRDITEKKASEEALKESQQRLDMAISGANLGIWDWYIQSGKTTYNDRWANMLDFDLDEIAPKVDSFIFLIHPEDQLRVLEAIQNHVEDKTDSFELEFRMKTKSGDYKWIYDRGRVMLWDDDGLPLRASGTHMDINERKKAEMALAEKFQELDEKNQELKRYIDSNMQLENFAYIASHDLKEPLRTIGNFAQLLSKKYREKLDQSGEDYLNFIVEGVKSMNQLIEDLLAYSRVNTQSHTIEEINVHNLALLIQHSISNYIAEKEAELTIKPLPECILANRTKIKQLFQNLIVNAIKFHKPGEKPQVLLDYQDKGSHWQFRVADKGIGIKEDFHDKIFLLFKKLHSRREYQGTGIGLALCKKIVEQHDGKIWVESTQGEGTTFFFTIAKEPEENFSPD